MKRWSLALIVTAASVLTGCNFHKSLESETHRFRVSAVEEFAIHPELVTKSILVPVRYQNKEHRFMLDTGTTGVVFDKVFRNDLGEAKKHVKLLPPEENKEIELFDAPDAFWGNIDLRSGGMVACLDLSTFRSLLGCNIRGIIGMTVLGRFVVQIDFLHSKVVIMPSDKQGHPEWGEPIALSVNENGLPTVRAHCSPIGEIIMLIDTGLSYNGSLAKADVQSSSENIQSTSKASHSVWLGGMVKNRKLRLPELRLGTLIYRDVELIESVHSSLGLGFLSRHLVTFDFPNRKLYLKQIDNPNHPGKLHISGLIFKEEPDHFIVGTIIPGGPAEKAGVQAGDAILQIEDKDTRAMEMWEAAKLLISTQEKEVRMMIEREGRVFELSFVLQKGL